MSGQAQPHRYQYNDYIQQEIKNCVFAFPHLKSTYGLLRLQNNEEKILLRLQGTISVVYQNQTYYIPLSVYFSPDYPYTPPHIFIEPTGLMRINPSDIVESTGHVVHQLLRKWSYPNNSNLVAVLAALRTEFGNIPPVYQQTHTQIQRYQSNPLPYSSAQAYPTNPSPNYAPFSHIYRQPSPQITQGLSNCQTTFAQNPTPIQAQNGPEMWQKHFQTVKEIVLEEISKLWEKISEESLTSDKLKKGYNEMIGKLNTIHKNQAIMDSYLDELKFNITNLKTLNAELKAYNKNIPPLADCVVPITPMDEQFLYSVSMDEASQDIILILNSAIERRRITTDEFLKQLGIVARKQFKSRARSLEIIEDLKTRGL